MILVISLLPLHGIERFIPLSESLVQATIQCSGATVYISQHEHPAVLIRTSMDGVTKLGVQEALLVSADNEKTADDEKTYGAIASISFEAPSDDQEETIIVFRVPKKFRTLFLRGNTKAVCAKLECVNSTVNIDLRDQSTLTIKSLQAAFATCYVRNASQMIIDAMDVSRYAHIETHDSAGACIHMLKAHRHTMRTDHVEKRNACVHVKDQACSIRSMYHSSNFILYGTGSGDCTLTHH